MFEQPFKPKRKPTRPIWLRSDQEARRAAILRAAARCFTRQGYHGTTIADIASRLNVTKGALYHYVKNKEEILVACHRIALDLAMRGLEIAKCEGGPPATQLKIALHHYIEGVTDQLQGTVVLLEEGMLAPHHYREVVRGRDKFEKRIRALVQAGVAQGQFAPCDIKMVVFAMLGAANWVSKWYAPGGARSATEVADILVEYLVGGLASPPVASRARTMAPSGERPRQEEAWISP
jgi:TetR/AcrR family transcriptional regulator